MIFRAHGKRIAFGIPRARRRGRNKKGRRDAAFFPCAVSRRSRRFLLLRRRKGREPLLRRYSAIPEKNRRSRAGNPARRARGKSDRDGRPRRGGFAFARARKFFGAFSRLPLRARRRGASAPLRSGRPRRGNADHARRIQPRLLQVGTRLFPEKRARRRAENSLLRAGARGPGSGAFRVGGFSARSPAAARASRFSVGKYFVERRRGALHRFSGHARRHGMVRRRVADIRSLRRNSGDGTARAVRVLLRGNGRSRRRRRGKKSSARRRAAPDAGARRVFFPFGEKRKAAFPRARASRALHALAEKMLARERAFRKPSEFSTFNRKKKS